LSRWLLNSTGITSLVDAMVLLAFEEDLDSAVCACTLPEKVA
jgi:hypothetical protein